MFKDIIWDFDGTLFDTYPGTVSAFHKALIEEGVNQDENQILKNVKISVSHAINFYEREYNIDVKNFVDRFTYYEDILDEKIMKPFSNSRAICEYVKEKGGRNFLLTHRDKSTFRLLEYHNMLELFTEIVTTDNGFKRKPDPEAFTYIIDKYKTDKDRILGVGDREIDILAAHNAGIRACFFCSNNISCSCEADFIIDSLEELFKIL